MFFSDDYSEPSFDRLNEEEVEERIDKALSVIEDGAIFLALNSLEETVQLCIDYDYPEEGLKIVNAVLETVSYNSDFWQYKGTFHNTLGEFEEAYIALEKALELNPGDTETLINFAIANEGLGMIEESLKSLSKALDIEPTNLDVLLSLASLYEKKGMSEETIKLLKKVIELEPENSEAWYEMAYSLENLRRYNEAIYAYDKYIDLEPESYYGWYNKGIVLIQMNDFPNAIEHFEFAIMLNENFQSAYFNIGISYLTLEKYDEAVAAFSKAVKLEPEDDFAWLYLGKSLYGNNKTDEAIEAINKAVKIDEFFQEAYLVRGKIFEKLGRRTEALLDFNRVFLLASASGDERFTNLNLDEIYPPSSLTGDDEVYIETLNRIDKLLLVPEKGEEALELISSLEEKHPDDTQILLRKSLFYFEFGQYELGMNSFRAAVSKDKNLQRKLKKDFTGLLDSGILKEIIEGK